MHLFARNKTLPLRAALLCCLVLCSAPAWAGTSLSPWDNLGTSLQPDLNGGAGYLREDIEKRFTASAIGDSLTANSVLRNVFYDRLNNSEFTYRSIPGGTEVLNHGLPGGTTASIFNSAWAGDWGAGEGANFVVIMAGTNDIDYNRGDDINALANAMVANVQDLVYSVLGGQTDPNSRPSVIVMGIPCYIDADRTARAKVYNDKLRSSLKHIEIFSDANWYDTYDANDKTALYSLMEDDKHPNDDGMYRIAENWFEAVDALYNPKRISADNHVYKGDWYVQHK
ncbi:MAG: SGNH/GDSL hydrolase family protein [Desulfarculus sp.]|nr:SGNH/GDSL hydrolase family protein [Desulfarculus sp.]